MHCAEYPQLKSLNAEAAEAAEDFFAFERLFSTTSATSALIFCFSCLKGRDLYVSSAKSFSCISRFNRGVLEGASFHVDTRSDEFHSFAFQQLALQHSRTIRKQNPAAAADHSLPGYASGIGIAQRPSYLPRSPGVAGSTGHFAIRRNFPPWNATHRSLNIFKISHDHKY
jgi:hypothetical protein